MKNSCQTSGVRFIGSKADLLQFIESVVNKYCNGEESVFADLFCGTGVVSRHFKQLGYKVIANDKLTFCTIFAKANLLVNDEPSFSVLISEEGIPKEAPDSLTSHPYDFVLSYLNRLDGKKGFIYKNYSPEGTSSGEHERKYFTGKNAKKIDSIREKIEEWNEKDLLSEGERALLLSDLMKATNGIANTAGTYGYFMKEWDSRALKDLTLRRSPIIENEKKHLVCQEDANQLVSQIDSDILYLDPPYTWRHYGAYYHILETIVKWDKPEISGKSGLRPWEENKSKYCYRDKAADALAELIKRAESEHIFLSYNTEGLIDHERIIEILSQKGNPSSHKFEHSRYTTDSESKNKVKEVLYHV